MTANEIIKELKENEIIELQRKNTDLLTIRYRKFYSTLKSYNFELNCKAIYGCKGHKTAENKINTFLNRGFKIYKD